MKPEDPDCYSIKCKYLKEERDSEGYYSCKCLKLDHELENGFAIKYHSRTCGEIPEEMFK